MSPKSEGRAKGKGKAKGKAKASKPAEAQPQATPATEAPKPPAHVRLLSVARQIAAQYRDEHIGHRNPVAALIKIVDEIDAK